MKITELNPFGLLIEPKITGSEIQSLDVLKLKSLVGKHQLIVLRNFKTFEDSASLSRYAESWGELAKWPFGAVLELLESDVPEDHIFDNSYVPLHWDGMYRSHIPEYQLFHCVKAPSKEQGGRTVFSNTILALGKLSKDELSLFQNITGNYHREMEFYHSRVVSPVITKHPYLNHNVIRFNEPHNDNKGKLINPVEMTFSCEQKQIHRLEELLYGPDHLLAHHWEDGDLVIADNFSLLHGREAFESKSSRHIRRVQVLSEIPYENPSLEVLK